MTVKRSRYPVWHFSLQQKLALILLLSLLIALGVSALSLLAYDRAKLKGELGNELKVLADIVAQRSAAALMFEDEPALVANLASLMQKKSVEVVCVYQQYGYLFTAVDKTFPDGRRCPGFEELVDDISYQGDGMLVSRPVMVREKNIGKLAIYANLSVVDERSKQFIKVLAISASLAFLLAYIITMRLTRRLIQPLIKLANVASDIRKSGDYSKRAPPGGNDESGMLVKSFNAMVSQIQESQMRMADLVEELRARSRLTEAHAAQMAKQRDTVRTYFSGVSHDLRQPLQAIDMYVSVLKNSEASVEQREIFNKLQQAVENMGNLFRELLDTARLEARLDQKVETEPVDLACLLNKIRGEFETLAADKQLEFRLHAQSCQVLSEPTMLERVIRNLVSNAIRYTSRGGVLLGVRFRRERVWLEIRDTGRGIPEEKLPVIFEQFAQVSSSDASQGYGLGLSIVKRLIDNLGHELEIASTEGKGTLFRLILPWVMDAPKRQKSNETSLPDQVQRTETAARVQVSPEIPEREIPAATTPVDRQLAALGEDMNVLVVDDDSLVRDALAIMLKGWGMNVQGCSNGAEALAWAARHPSPSIIISDFNLGEQETGVTVIRQLREYYKRELPAIVITGNRDRKVWEHIEEQGLKVLAKPVKPPKLRALINYQMTRQAG